MSNKLCIEDIKGIKAFNNVDDMVLNKLADIGTLLELKKGRTLYNEGDSSDYIYAIKTGKISVSKHSRWGQKITFFILGKGDLVNELVLDGGKETVTAEAHVDTILLIFNKDDVFRLMKEHFGFTRCIITAMTKKQRRLYRQLKNTLTMRIDKKLSVKLWKLARDHGIKHGDWVVLDMKITVTSLSYLMGSSRETISRAMKILESKGLLKWQDRKILVKRNQLLSYYENDE